MISIHAAREGGDLTSLSQGTQERQISIHAAREGGDGLGAFIEEDIIHFNPRRP